MKTLLTLISIALFLSSCNQSFETKLIDETGLGNKTTERLSLSESLTININSITIRDSWILDRNSKRKLNQILPFQNLIITDSIDNHYVIDINSKDFFIPKADVKVNFSSKVTLNEFEIYDKPELTERTKQTIDPGTILIFAPNSLNNFYKVKRQGDKSWIFLRKIEGQLSGQKTDLSIAFRISEIRNSNDDAYVKEKQFNNLSNEEDFNRPEWLPVQEDSDLIIDEPML